MKRRQKKTELNVSVDMGGSLTKAIGGTNFENRIVLGMEPSLTEVPPQILSNVMGLENTDLENKAWIEVGGKTYAVVYLAQVLTVANPQLRALKATIAIPKILGVIWVFKERLQLSNNLTVNLSCLLPPGEIKDREKLKTDLENVIKEGINTPTGKLFIKVNYYNCLAEGTGIYMLHRAKKGKELVNDAIVAVVMLGYRNASVMVFRRGIIKEYQTKELGFVHLIKSMVKQLSGQTLEKLTPAIAKYRETGSEIFIHSVLLSDNKEMELEEVKKAHQISQETYEYELLNWLKEVLPLDIEEVILAGGTSDDTLIQAKLLEYFDEKKVYLHAQVEFPSDLQALNLGNRLGDVWCLWDFMNLKINKNNQRKVA